jgi:hypothetical protein
MRSNMPVRTMAQVVRAARFAASSVVGKSSTRRQARTLYPITAPTTPSATIQDSRVIAATTPQAKKTKQTEKIPLPVLASTWLNFPQTAHFAGFSRADQRTAMPGTPADLQCGHLCMRLNVDVTGDLRQEPAKRADAARRPC